MQFKPNARIINNTMINVCCTIIIFTQMNRKNLLIHLMKKLIVGHMEMWKSIWRERQLLIYLLKLKTFATPPVIIDLILKRKCGGKWKE